MGHLQNLEAEVKKNFGKPKLTINLVPQTCWCSNVRKQATKQQWDILRKETYRQAGYVCEVCGGKGSRWPVECHERWQYQVDKDECTQRLHGLIALCPACHAVKHYGRSQVIGREDEAAAHLAKINNWTAAQVTHYVGIAFAIWEYRSQRDWILDLSWLEETFKMKIGSKQRSLPGF